MRYSIWLLLLAILGSCNPARAEPPLEIVPALTPEPDELLNDSIDPAASPAANAISTDKFLGIGRVMYVNQQNTECFCTGTLLSPYWVLTAGHCATSEITGDEHPKENLRFIPDATGTSVEILEVVRHPKYLIKDDAALEDFYARNGIAIKSYNGYDLALLRLKQPVNLPKFPRILGEPWLGKSTAVGRGPLFEGGDDCSSSMKVVPFIVVWGKQRPPQWLHFVTANDILPKALWKGDSGGPLFAVKYDDETGEIIEVDTIHAVYSGVEFYYSPFGTISHLYIFTRVDTSPLDEWVRLTMETVPPCVDDCVGCRAVEISREWLKDGLPDFLNPTQVSRLFSNARKFRDSALAKSAHGRELTNLYYVHFEEVQQLLVSNPSLALMMIDLAAQLSDQMDGASTSGRVGLTAEQWEQGQGFLTALHVHASPELQQAIDSCRSHLDEFRIPSASNEHTLVFFDAAAEQEREPSLSYQSDRGPVDLMSGTFVPLVFLFGFSILAICRMLSGSNACLKASLPK